MSEHGEEFKIKSPPEDAISNITFAPNSQQYLLASSWDKTVRLYDIVANTEKTKYAHEGAVLDCCFQDTTKVWSGGLDRCLKSFDVNTGSEAIIGRHEDAIRCVEFSPECHFIITGSWDQTVKTWDHRTNACTFSFPQNGTVYTLALSGEKLVVGTSDRKVLVWDLRALKILQRRESSLKYQTRCIRTFPNKQGYVLSSIEGRVAVEYFDVSPEVQKKKYAFKCHRIKEGDKKEEIYPVNAISFNEKYSTFATGGSDGFVNIWDGANKKRLCQFHRYPTGITSLSFSSQGSHLAIATSYNYEFETHPVPLPKDQIYVRPVSDAETKPK
ncbi:hypothetical protein QYM36_011200 [Artemia franciscana]|uniref:Mitotic checkpoint protein BUB3 n=2 Tax=Artemia franciscana TaxID=6661 RepID=A0AA88HMV7_ARTSF|nr:hypothetical protein QYM36_011200 [Artemia franciscana]